MVSSSSSSTYTNRTFMVSSSSSSSTDAPSPLIYFYNGINNSREDATQLAGRLRTLTGVRCVSCYNDATSPKIMEILTNNVVVGGGAAAAGGALLGGALAPVTIGVAGVAYIVTKPEIEKIQKRKDSIASEEAEHIIEYLNQSRFAHLILVGHSQGGDIVTRILDEIKEQAPQSFKQDFIDRLSAITVGGLEIVHCNQIRSDRVFNLVHEDDHVVNNLANLYKSLFLSPREICHEGCEADMSGTGGHGAAAYFDNELFVDQIKEFCLSPSREFDRTILALRKIKNDQSSVESNLKEANSLILEYTCQIFEIKTVAVADLVDKSRRKLTDIENELNFIKKTSEHTLIKKKQSQFYGKIETIELYMKKLTQNRAKTWASVASAIPAHFQPTTTTHLQTQTLRPMTASSSSAVSSKKSYFVVASQDQSKTSTTAARPASAAQSSTTFPRPPAKQIPSAPSTTTVRYQTQTAGFARTQANSSAAIAQRRLPLASSQPIVSAVPVRLTMPTQSTAFTVRREPLQTAYQSAASTTQSQRRFVVRSKISQTTSSSSSQNYHPRRESKDPI